MNFLRLALLGLGFPLAAETLVFNSGFEMGTDGFMLTRILAPAANPNLKFIPLQNDTTNQTEGRQSLAILNPYGEFFELHSKGFKLAANTEYTFSVLAKGQAPNARLRVWMIHVRDGRWQVVGKEFRLSDNFRTYRWSFNTGAKGEGVWHIQLSPGMREEQTPIGTVWLDELNVFKSTDNGKPNQPGAYLEAAIRSDHLFEKEQGEAPVVLVVRNKGNRPTQRKLTVRGMDETFRRELFRNEFDISLAPGEMREFHFRKKLDRYGSVLLEVDGADDVCRGYYIVIGKYTSKPIKLLKEFCVGINGGLNYRLPPFFAQAGYQAFNAPLEKYPELLSRMGCRLLREHDGGIASTQWSAVEPEQGKWDFSHLDRVLSYCQQYNIELLPVLGRTEFVEPFKGWGWKTPQPEWVRKLCVRQYPDMGGWNSGHVILPPLNLWMSYIQTVTKHLKGKIQAYEIVNEPNLHLWPQNYITYLTAAKKTIRHADPAAKIAAFCVTSDFGADGNKWLNECIRLNGLNGIDIAGFHPYESRELGSLVPADRMIKAIRTQVLKHIQVPLWNTELYYLFDSDTSDMVAQGKALPQHVAQRFLTDLGEGVGQAPFAHQTLLFKNILIPGFHSNPPLDMIPSEHVVVYNMLARHLEGAKPVLKRKFPQGVVLYAFQKRDGTLIASVWNYRKQSGLSMDLCGMRLLDLFGNPVEGGILPLTDFPYFLEQGTVNRNDFINRLNLLQVQVAQEVAAVPFLRIFPHAGKHMALLQIKNQSARTQQGIIGLFGAVENASPVHFQLKPDETATLEIPVVIRNRNATQELRIGCSGRLHRVSLSPIWNRSENSGTVLSAGSSTCRVSRTGDRILIEGFIPDATDAGVSGLRHPWETDSVELFIDAAPERPGERLDVSYLPDTIRFFITPRDPEGKQLKLQGTLVKLEDCRLSVITSPGKWRFQLEFPAKDISPRRMGLEMIVNDSVRKRIGSLADSREAFRNRFEFAIIHFQEKE